MGPKCANAEFAGVLWIRETTQGIPGVTPRKLQHAAILGNYLE